MQAKVKSTGEIIEVETVYDEMSIGNVHFIDASNTKYFLQELDFIDSNSEETMVEGWIALDEFDFGDAHLHIEKPHYKDNPIADTGDYSGSWESNGKIYTIDKNLIPNLTCDTEPYKVKITITPLEL